MLKRSITAIQKWLSPERTAKDALSMQDEDTSSARRSFFKKAAVGAVSLTTAAGLAKVVVDSAPQTSLQDSYIKGSQAGEDELMKREYVLMSDQEKAEMVQTFINNYSNPAA